MATAFPFPFLLFGFGFSLTIFGGCSIIGGGGGSGSCGCGAKAAAAAACCCICAFVGLAGFLAGAFERGFAFGLAAVAAGLIDNGGDRPGDSSGGGGFVMSFSDALNALGCSLIDEVVRSRKLNDDSESCELVD